MHRYSYHYQNEERHTKKGLHLISIYWDRVFCTGKFIKTEYSETLHPSSQLPPRRSFHSTWLVSGLILVGEPYYNEAGYERQRGTQQGLEASIYFSFSRTLQAHCVRQP